MYCLSFRSGIIQNCHDSSIIDVKVVGGADAAHFAVSNHLKLTSARIKLQSEQYYEEKKKYFIEAWMN